MSGKSIKDAIKVLQAHFTTAHIPPSLPSECRRTLRIFVDDLPAKYGEEEAGHVNTELKSFWDKYVAANPDKFGAFAGVLKELRPAIATRASVWQWWQHAVKPVIGSTNYKQAAVEDAKEYLSEVMMAFDVDNDEGAKRPVSERLCRELLSLYISHTASNSTDDEQLASSQAQVAGQVESVLAAFGRKRPKDLFHGIDDLIVSANTRLQALTLLSSFLQHQAPHLYLVLNTPLVEHLLKCLMNDTSTTLLSVALTCLIMLLPHIPGSLGPHLPRMFLIYSRLLAWEKFSPTSTEAQKTLVTDDRVSTRDTDQDPGDVGIDPNWQKVRPAEDAIEISTPHLLTYFTYLYGLYPLNFMSYIRKPRKYLRNIDFPGADAFDLDQTVIRKRSDQFGQVHLLHPNFYNLTIEEELIDPKWPRMDPADVVGECHSLYINRQPALASPDPLPSTRTAELPPAGWPGVANNAASELTSPAVSHFSLRSNESSAFKTNEINRTLHTSPALRDVPKFSPLTPTVDSVRSTLEKQEYSSQTDLMFLQQQLTVLRNDLNFERWHKAQYSQHISQLMRKNVKDATIEAETLNLINANKVLRRQIDQLRKAREATIKDSTLTRKQASSLEADMTDRFNRFKKEQEIWQADAAELQRLRTEVPQLRDLLSQAESKGLEKAHELQLAQRDLEHLETIRNRLAEAQRKVETFEYQQWEFHVATRQMMVLEHEKLALEVKVQQLGHDRGDLDIEEIFSDLGKPMNMSFLSDSHAPGTGTKAPPVRHPYEMPAPTSQDEVVVHHTAGLTWKTAGSSPDTEASKASTTSEVDRQGGGAQDLKLEQNDSKSERGKLLGFRGLRSSGS